MSNYTASECNYYNTVAQNSIRPLDKQPGRKDQSKNPFYNSIAQQNADDPWGWGWDEGSSSPSEEWIEINSKEENKNEKQMKKSELNNNLNPSPLHLPNQNFYTDDSSNFETHFQNNLLLPNTPFRQEELKSPIEEENLEIIPPKVAVCHPSYNKERIASSATFPTVNSKVPQVDSSTKLDSEIETASTDISNLQLHPKSQTDFRNREEYFENTHLGENIEDNNVVYNEIVDDEPLPPPGLRRLVTGQTVSFDDSPASPAFDRYVPGQGDGISNTINRFNDFTENRMERLVTGCVADEGFYNQQFPPVFQQSPIHNSTEYIKNDMNHVQDSSANVENNELRNFTNDMEIPERPWKPSSSATAQRRNEQEIATNIEAQDSCERDDYPMLFEHEFVRSSSLESEMGSSNPDPTRNILDLSQEIELEPRMELEGAITPQTYVATQPNPGFQKLKKETLKNPFPMYKNQRMAVEGAPEQIVYKPPMLTSDDSPAYDQWYQIQPGRNESQILKEDERKKNIKVVNELHGHDVRKLADSGQKPVVKTLEIPKNIIERPNKDATSSIQQQDKDHRNELVRNRTEGINLQDFEQLDDSSSSDFNQEFNNGFKNSTVLDTPVHHEVSENHRPTSLHNLNYTNKNKPKMKDPVTLRQDSHPNAIEYSHSNHSKPRERKISKQQSKDQVYDRNHTPPRELRRMVVGETASSSSGMRPSIDDEGLEQEYINEEIPPRNNSVFRNNKETLSTIQSDRRRRKVDNEPKHRNRQEIESDNEDYEESIRHYDISPDRESRGYRARNARYTRKARKDRDRDSFAYSQDESYYDDDDYYDSSRELSRYQSRRQYDRYVDRRYYGPNETYREDPRHYRDHRDDYFKAPLTRQYQDSYHGKKGRVRKEETQDDRPSSRSGSEYRRGPRDYPYNRSYGKGSYYMDHAEPQYATVPGRTIVDLDGRLINWKDLLEFRSRDPEGYAIWYNTYTIARKRGGEAHSISSNYHPDRRGSGHSGQSSGDDEPIVKSNEKFDIQDEPMKYQVEQSISETRSSPVKFSIAHVKGCFNKLGQMIIVNPNFPTDGQPAVVEIANVTPPQDQDLIEFLNFPGPFIVGETHVNTVSEYLKHYAAFSTNRSERLLYQLIDLIIRLRGVTDGIAISELLMEDYRTNNDQDCLISPDEGSMGFDNPRRLTTAEVSEKYMRLLLQGNKIAALECAISNQEWGHAFLLASKMDAKYYSSVLARFDSTINNNSPLKTLYQFMSGQIPQAAIRCGDDKWGDWRPHLAMILSNPTGNEELNRKAIIALGDSLGAQKDVYSSHFCYLTAQTEFEPTGTYGRKYTLLGIHNSDLVDCKPEFVSNRAILLTQAYEFAKRLQRKEFCIRTLMPYKYLLSMRLMEYGKNDAAATYLEAIALDILANPSVCNVDLIKLVIDASEKVTYANRKPIYTSDIDNREKWLIDLKGTLSNGTGVRITAPEPPSQPQFQQPESEIPKWENENNIQMPPMYVPPHNEYQPEIYQPQQEPQTFENQNWDNSPVIDVVPDQPYITQNVEYDNYELNNQPKDNVEINEENSYYQPNWNNAKKITISSQATTNYFNDHEDISNKPMGNSSVKTEQKPTKEKSENKVKKIETGDNNNNSGWLGGIFGKLALRPKNQMKLPDDKNPSIVWNDEQRRWVNVNSDENDTCDNVAPPPKALPKFSNDQPQQPQSLPPSGFQNNQQQHQSLPQNGFLPPANQFQSQPQSLPTSGYKISRSKGMKSNYVNVLSQGNAISTSNSQPPSLDIFPTHQESMEYFIPPSGDKAGGNVDFANNSNVPSANDIKQSSLGPQEGKIGEVPMFYNPAQYNNRI